MNEHTMIDAHGSPVKVPPPPPVSGYRQLTEEDVLAMNELKAAGNALLAAAELTRVRLNVDGRWHSIGVTHIQQGVMALVRAVTQPEGV